MILLLYSWNRTVAYCTPSLALEDLKSPVIIIYVFEDGKREVKDAKRIVAWVNETNFLELPINEIISSSVIFK
jgi:hypothetical protein